MEAEATSEGTVRFPPGAAAPKAADRIAALKEPDHLAKLNQGKAAWYEKPLEERRRITAERRTLAAAGHVRGQRTHHGAVSTLVPDGCPTGPFDPGVLTARLSDPASWCPWRPPQGPTGSL